MEPNPPIMNEEVTVACTNAFLIISISSIAPTHPTIFAKNAPANESPHPVGSITSLVGYEGRDIVPQGR